MYKCKKAKTGGFKKFTVIHRDGKHSVWIHSKYTIICYKMHGLKINKENFQFSKLLLKIGPHIIFR